MIFTGEDYEKLTLYHPPSQKSTVYGRWKKASLTAKLLGRATLILRYYVIRVLRNAVAASNHMHIAVARMRRKGGIAT